MKILPNHSSFSAGSRLEIYLHGKLKSVIHHSPSSPVTHPHGEVPLIGNHRCWFIILKVILDMLDDHTLIMVSPFSGRNKKNIMPS